jgi:hypothetical protein
VAVAVTLSIAAGLAACGGGGPERGAARPSRHPRAPATSTAPPASNSPSTATRPPLDLATRPCQAVTPPATYQHVVVVMMENRTWSQVGGPGFAAMPYLASLAHECAYYRSWTETNRAQGSLTQYIGLTSGVDNPRTVDDCSPSETCSSLDDNVFRQVREAGGSARSYVEGATQPCSASGNAPKHVPALYYRGQYSDATGTHRDSDFCAAEIRPMSELDPDRLPTLAFVTPDLCHDGHDCANAMVDAWARQTVGAVLAGASYRSGTAAVLVFWDEYTPVPNLLIAPAARPGPASGGASHAAALATVEAMLGLPVLAPGQLPAPADLRATSGL